jgi:hypothetical protein
MKNMETNHQDATRIRELEEVIKALFKDMKMRIDVQHNMPPELQTCGGYKDEDGVYTFPWGNSVQAGLEAALTKSALASRQGGEVGGNGLKCCPFCGDDDIMPAFVMADKIPEHWQCGCDNCRIYKNGSTEEYAIKLWNTRAPINQGEE